MDEMESLWPHLKNAPIVEALVDFRVVRIQAADLPLLDTITPLIVKEYPAKKERRQQQVEFKVEPGQTLTVNASPGKNDGYIYTSADAKYVLQSQIEGFTLSRLSPYQSWQIFRIEAARLWKIYVETIAPDKITRIAVRYINNLVIPFPVADIRDYLRAPIGLAAGLPQIFNQFSSAIVSPWPSYEAHSIVRVQSGGQVGDKLPIILDIEVFRNVDFAPTSSQVWDISDNLREIKNKIFFEGLTYKFLELCN